MQLSKLATVIKLLTWGLSIALVAGIIVLVAIFIISYTENGLEARKPIEVKSNGSLFVRGNIPGARCNVFMVEMEGHKYIVAVSANGCAVCPAVVEKENK